MAAGNADRADRDDIRRADLAEMVELAEDRAPDGDLPDDAVVSNEDLDPELLAAASRGTGDDNDDIPEHLWPSRGVDTMSEYSRHAAEDPQEAIERLPLDDDDIDPPMK